MELVLLSSLSMLQSQSSKLPSLPSEGQKVGNYMSLSKKREEELGGPGDKASCRVVWNLSDCRSQHSPPTGSVREPNIYQYLFS